MTSPLVISLVRLAGFEPATLEFVVRYSIQMSYRRRTQAIVLDLIALHKCFLKTEVITSS